MFPQGEPLHSSLVLATGSMSSSPSPLMRWRSSWRRAVLQQPQPEQNTLGGSLHPGKEVSVIDLQSYSACAQYTFVVKP